MQMFHQAIKVTIVTEKFVEEKILRILESHGAKGYTMLAAGGRGEHHIHAIDSRASVIDDFANIRIEAVVSARETAESIARAVMEEVFDRYPGILYLNTVEVWRQARF
jgi:nitrogen regulatory protein PII